MSDVYVIIGNAGLGRQTMWPSSYRPGVYHKEEAVKIVGDLAEEDFGGVHWHFQPLSRDLLDGRFGVSYGQESYIGLQNLIEEYEAGGVLSDDADEQLGWVS